MTLGKVPVVGPQPYAPHAQGANRGGGLGEGATVNGLGAWEGTEGGSTE